jgi:ribulose-phosphate 3-epimerase
MTEPLRLDLSLWSADLAHLAAEIARMDGIADSFHFDVCDGHFAPVLLFFPELVARLRPLTSKPFHLHLMATRPLDLLPAFLEAGVDEVTVPLELGKRAWQVKDAVKKAGKRFGVSVDFDTPVHAAAEWRLKVQTLVMMGTPMGVKGCEPSPDAPIRMREMARLFVDTETRLVADGAIRRESVPELRAAGAAGVVPGSLIFGAEDPAAVAEWLRGL